jgi:RHS repeat-associated protein
LISAGDTVNAETWVRYENKLSYSRNTSIGAIAALLSGNFSFTSGFEGFTAPQTTTAFSNALTSAGFMGDGSDDERPFAYLNYILFDESMTLVDAGWQRVVDSAGFDVGEEALANRHERIAFEQPIYVPENGYIYIWVSNESEGTKVWFDDVKITHTQITVTQASDYGVWGDVLRELKAPEFTYRHGYQGNFSEKDKETGWNHFELREFDPVIGRWLVKDPYREFWSPYIGMGNNPVSGIDPDGGKVKRFWKGIVNPNGNWERFQNWAFGTSFLNDAADFKKEHPDIEVEYQKTNNGFYYGAKALIPVETELENGESIIAMVQIGFGKADFGIFAPGIPFNPSPLLGTVTKSGSAASGWIAKKIFRNLSPTLQKKFIAAMRKGIVGGGQRDTGIVKIDRTEKLFQSGYTHKIKILGHGGDFRIYGKQLENGHFVFDLIEGH